MCKWFKREKEIAFNNLASRVTITEGKKESMSVAQVKEALKLICIELSKEGKGRTWAFIKKHGS